LSGAGLSIIDALCESGLAASKSEARRTVTQGGAYVNNVRIESLDHVLTPADLSEESVVVLRSGKKKFALLQFK
jgi:tyrosyl-tRNA synthetase